MAIANVVPKNMDQVQAIQWSPYVGEDIVTKTIIRGGKKIQEIKYVEDQVKAIPRGNAYIIGNGPSRQGFDLTLLKTTGQIYGCNALYRDFIPDFLFSVDRFMSEGIVRDKIYEKTTCYAPSIEYSRSGGKLNLIPNNPHWISGSTAFHTACVHGHKKLYLLGFDFQEYGKGELNNIYQDTEFYGPRDGNGILESWLRQLRVCIKQRPYCHFTVVHDNPPEFLNHLQTGVNLGNTSLMNYNEFKTKVLNQPV